jgi:hypothetical protein
MTDHDTPVDAFADLNLEEFKADKRKPRPAVIRPPRIEKEMIRAMAEKGEFRSRQPATVKPKIVAKTFSIFKEECDIINSALRAYQEYPDERLGQPSSSDVVRAALHAFVELSEDEQVQLVKEHRGRGRR